MKTSDITNMRIAISELMQRDQKLATIIDEIGEYRPEARMGGFADLTRSIVGQQLSKASAQTIYSMFQALFVGGQIEASQLCQIADENLRKAGLSPQKIRYLRDLTQRVLSGSVDFEQIAAMDDEAVIEALTRVKGIGRWTAEMYLMFSLGRLDVFPIDDLALRTAMREVYGLIPDDFDKRALRIADRWKPYRSVACWYLYAHLDGTRLARSGEKKNRHQP